jgi:hypothetical protein
MASFADKLDNAAGGALCAALQVSGEALVGAGAVSLAFGGAGAVPIALGAAALMASEAGCTWDPDGNYGPPAGAPIDICDKPVGETRITTTVDGLPNDSTAWLKEIYAITFVRSDPCSSGAGKQVYRITGLSASGGNVDAEVKSGFCDTSPEIWSQEFRNGDACEVPITPADPLPVIPPYIYTDPDDGCKLTVNWKGFSTDGNGHVSPVFKIEPGPQQLRGSGGIIGGCNFEPVIYTGPPGGPPRPPITGPWDPLWDLPDAGPNPWADFLRNLAAGVAAEVIYNTLQSFFQTIYPGLIYRMVSVCETDSGGEPISESVDVPIPPLAAPDAQLARLDAIVALLQASKNFKQPVCPPDRPELLGDWVTVRFESLEISPQGTRPLRKLFRYRSQSALDLGQIAAYWENFQWNAGPVCVQHKGAWWGTPQCWASNAEEGKRVIRFAGLEAGIDPDGIGEWVISGSSDPRFGMPGTMQVAKVQGLEWVTSRQGPSGLPLLTVDP